MDQPKKGLFISENELPKEIWEAFFYLARAHNFTPKELILKMIVSEVNEIKDLRLPVLDQIINKVGIFIEKKIKIKRI